MRIEQTSIPAPAEYYTPSKPCARCGTSKRYKSTRHCVECKRRYDQERKGDRRSLRVKAIERLEYKQGIPIREFPREVANAFLRAHYPNMEVK